MANQTDDLIPTRATLLGRLKNSKDQSSWQEFFDTYSRLIYGVARKAGLNDEGSQEVLQETMKLVAEKMPKFQYDPRFGSFKGWLLNLTRMQIVSRSLKRRPSSHWRGNEKKAAEADASERTVEGVWDTDWQNNLKEAAIANVKRQEPKKFQMYDFCVNKQWPMEKLAPVFGVTAAEAREAIESITGMIAAETTRLEREML